MVNNANLRESIAKIQAKAKVDRQWWDKERADIQSKFMKELDEGTPSPEATKVTAPGTTNSDEDAVLVEGGGPAASGAATGSKGGTKKRKGKK